MATVPKVFISATSRDLASSRDIVRLAANDMEWMPVEQKHFPADYRELKEVLKSKISECDAFIAVVGFQYGSEPTNGTDQGARRSYTQIEYEFALESKKPVFVFFCEEDYPFDCEELEEPEELRQLQLEHRKRIVESGRKRECLHSKENLSEKVRTLELFLREVRQTKKRRGCTLNLVVSITACLVLGVLAALYDTRSHTPMKNVIVEAPYKGTAQDLIISHNNWVSSQPEIDGKKLIWVGKELRFPETDDDGTQSYLYLVQKGDTIESIAKAMKVTEESLLVANSRKESGGLLEGMFLLIPPQPEDAPKESRANDKK